MEENLADRTRFSTPEWEGPSDGNSRIPQQSTPRSILRKGDTIEELIEQEILSVNDYGVSVRDPSRLQVDRNQILKDLFIEGNGRALKNPSHIILGGPSGKSRSAMELDEVEEGLDIVLQNIFDTQVTLTIKELAEIFPALAKFGEIPL